MSLYLKALYQRALKALGPHKPGYEPKPNPRERKPGKYPKEKMPHDGKKKPC